MKGTMRGDEERKDGLFHGWQCTVYLRKYRYGTEDISILY